MIRYFIQRLCFCLLIVLLAGRAEAAEDIQRFLVQDSFEEDIRQNSILLFEDTFDGTDLDDTKWERCPEWNRQGELNVWDDSMSYLDGDGNLVLRAEWNPQDGRIHSGAVRTYGRFSESFAYYEAAIKFEKALGIWGAFWMMAGNVGGERHAAADGIEIDIIETIHAHANMCSSAMHWDGYGRSHRSLEQHYESMDVYDGQFHTFGLWRTEEAYRFYIDRKEVWQVSADECIICPEPGYMKLTVEGAAWAGAGTKASIDALPAEMLVDYVRVYRQKPF